jgi:hypothetical protein
MLIQIPTRKKPTMLRGDRLYMAWRRLGGTGAGSDAGSSTGEAANVAPATFSENSEAVVANERFLSTSGGCEVGLLP